MSGYFRLGGDLSGNAPIISVVGLQGVALSNTAPTNGQVIQYNSGTGEWVATTPTGAAPALTDGNIFVGNGSNVATDVSMGGDTSITNLGVVTLDTIQGVTVLANGTSRNITIGNSSHGNLNTDCIAIGDNALNLANANTGPGHVAIGTNTLKALTNFATNCAVAIGYNAGMSVTGGGEVAIGNNAMAQNSGGGNVSVAIGNNALAVANAGSTTVCIGGDCMQAVTSASSTVAIGYNTMSVGGGGTSNNTAVGPDCMRFAPVNQGNSAFGWQAAFRMTGSNNTCIGTQSGLAGGGIQTGSNNQLIGYAANSSALGASNEFVLGNSSIGVLRCQQNAISALSDRRDKKNIVTIPAGLDFVEHLTPVSFDWNMRDGGKVDIKEFGFIAQDLQQVQIDTNIVLPGLVYESNPERLEASPGTLIPVMVKAIQELSAQVKSLQAEIAELKK